MESIFKTKPAIKTYSPSRPHGHRNEPGKKDPSGTSEGIPRFLHGTDTLFGTSEKTGGKPGSLPGGKSLDADTRSRCETRFDTEIRDVRVHTDRQAAESARALDADAFTVGQDIYFGSGQFNPDSKDGQKLLIHELAHVLQNQSAASNSGEPIIRRRVVRNAAGDPVSFEFRIGTEISRSFANLGRRLTAGGSISDDGLRSMRNHALQRRGTVSDNERMFMAGLMDPANIVLLQAASIRAGGSVTFPLCSISTARMQHVIDLDRETMPESVTDPLTASLEALRGFRLGDAMRHLAEAQAAASEEIMANAGSFKPQARRLIAYAQANNIFLPAILRAMFAAASDNTAGDKVLAGTAYAIAAAGGSPMAGALLNGNLKVDALIPRAFARLPGLTGNETAIYVTIAQASGLKGDTVYLQTSININNLRDRSAVIHELQHAADDRAAPGTGPVQRPAKQQLELDAYRTQARYILGQMVSQTPDERRRSAVEVTSPTQSILFGALVLEGQTNPTRYRSILELIFGAASPPFRRTPAQIGGIMALPPATIESAVLQDIRAGYGITATDTGVTEGLAGESLIHWIYRI
jgi:hypothetical protein